MQGSATRAIILCRLRETNGYVSGQTLAVALGMSRPAVFKHVQRLREEGYQIEATPRLGYRLAAMPDVLAVEELRARLETKIVGRQLHHLVAAASTNDVVRELATAGAPEGTVVVAERQEAGRGRLGRAWASPPGGIYFSFVLRPTLPPHQLGHITLMTAVAVASAIRQSTGVAATIKWPNDVLVDERKLVGILTEMTGETDVVRFVIIGVGINANTSPSDYPRAARPSLTTLAAVLGHPVDRAALLVAVLQRLDAEWGRLSAGKTAAVLDEWRTLSSTMGRRVRVTTVAGVAEGYAQRINDAGELVVVDDAGRTQAFASGEVQHLRTVENP